MPTEWDDLVKELFLQGLDDDTLKDVLRSIANNTSLTSISLTEGDITAEGVDELLKHLSNKPALKELNLSMNFIGDNGATMLAERLPSQIDTLTLVQVGLTDEGAKALAKNNTLTSLDITGNTISAEAAGDFVFNETLTTLEMDTYKLSEELQEAIQKTLEVNRNRSATDTLKVGKEEIEEPEEEVNYNTPSFG